MTRTQIDEARAELAALTADEQELEALTNQRAEEITVMKASGSRDFAALAALEGQRAALQTMLTEQRGYVAAAQTRITALEAEAHRRELLSRIGEKAARISAAQQNRQARMVALRDSLTELLAPILEAGSEWRGAWREWTELADELRVKVFQAQATMLHGQAGEVAAYALYAELEALGVDTAPLRWEPLDGGRYPLVGALSLPHESFPPSPSVFAGELDWAVYDLIGHAGQAQYRAAGQSTNTGLSSGPAVVAPEVLASTAYAPPEAPRRAPETLFTILPAKEVNA